MNRTRIWIAALSLSLAALVSPTSSAAPPAEAPGAPPAEAPPEGEAKAEANAPSPDDPEFIPHVLDSIDDLYRGQSSHGLMEMKVKTKHWTRTIAMESWSKGEDYSLVRIVAPKKERGTSTLKANKELFTYLSKTGRTIKISGGMMGGSWMGSHFSNDDLVRDSRMADDFTYERGRAQETPETYVFVLTPKEDIAIVWGRIEVTVTRDGLLPTKQVFFDEEGEAMRLLEFTDYKMVQGRNIPSRTIMKPLDSPGEYTELRHHKIEFDVGLEDNFFSLQKLRSL